MSFNEFGVNTSSNCILNGIELNLYYTLRLEMSNRMVCMGELNVLQIHCFR